MSPLARWFRRLRDACWKGASPSDSYVDFDLHILPNGPAPSYRVSASGSDFGQDDHCFELPLDDGGSWEIPLKPQDAALETARQLGDRLFRAAFGGPILALFQQEYRRARVRGERLRIRLRLANVPRLARLPWELLFDGSRRSFLLLAPGLSLVRYLDSPTPPGEIAVPPPVRILVVTASPMNLRTLEVEAELQLLEKALQPLLLSGLVLLERLQHATRESLADLLDRWPCHVLHFIGHGVQEPRTALALEDERRKADWLDPADLIVLLGDQASLRLVVLNACQGAAAQESDAFSGMAQALVRHGMQAVVAMQSPVCDRAALLFSRRFFAGLARGLYLSHALGRTRQRMFLRGFKTEWAAPVMFTRCADGPLIARGSRMPVGLIGLVVVLAAVLALLSWQALRTPVPPGEPWPVPTVLEANPPECPSPPGVDIRFALILPGKFTMGDDKGPEESRPEHEVEITKAFCLGRHEVTQEQWRAIMGPNSEDSPVRGDRYPVTKVSWNRTQEFSRELNEKQPDAGYRLPTEAQWEYAASAGAREGVFPHLDGTFSSVNCLSAAEDPPRDKLRRNRFGLYDMVGNVGEWTQDYYESYKSEPVIDPTGSSSGSGRVWRGGSFESGAKACSSVARSSRKPDRRSRDTGLRIVRDPVFPAPSPASLHEVESGPPPSR